jgi:hypothetical protein
MPYAPLALVAAFWLVLFVLGYPMPSCDDIFYAGASLHLAGTGKLSNPYVPAANFLGAADNFFVYPPFQFFALAAWLKIVGISAAALRAYQCLAGAIASFALFDFIAGTARGGRAAVFAGAVSLSIALCFSNLGLRPDFMALALFCAGLRFIKAATLPAIFVSSLLLFLSTITSATFGPFVLLVLIYGTFCSPTRVPAPKFLARRGAILLAALLVALVFLLMIDFRLPQFLDVFNRARIHATFRRPFLDHFQDWWLGTKYMVEVMAPYVAAIGMPILTWLLRRQLGLQMTPSPVAFLVLAALLTAVAVLNSGAGSRYLYLVILIEALVFAAMLPAGKRMGWSVFLGWFGFLVVIGGVAFLQVFMRPFLSQPDNVATIRAALVELQPNRIYLDSAAAARLYDFRLPSNACDCFWGLGGVWGRFPQRVDYPANSVMIVSTQTARQLFPWIASGIPPRARFVPLPVHCEGSSESSTDPYDLILVPLNFEARP